MRFNECSRFIFIVPPELLETLDYEQIFEEMRLRLISLDPTYSALVESDPAYKILEVAAYFRLIDRQRINDAAVATMLAYAQKADLDNIGARYNVERQVITPEDTSTVPPTEAVMEPDDDFRLRIQLRLEGMSVAGPVNAYKYHALSAHAHVADVTAISPNPGEVLVTVLSREGNGTASDDVLTAVRTALNAEDVRPLTDAVTVQSATITNYQIDAILYMPPGRNMKPPWPLRILVLLSIPMSSSGLAATFVAARLMLRCMFLVSRM